MSKASPARLRRKEADKAAKAAASIPSKPTSVIRLTEGAEPGSFTVDLGLHGARMELLNPGQAQAVTIVDVMALAISSLIRNNHPALIEAVDLVNTTIMEATRQTADGVSPDVVSQNVGAALYEAPAEAPEAE